MKTVSLVRAMSKDEPLRRPRILDLLPSKNDADLLIIFQNCVRASARGPNEEARQVLLGLEQEWQRRAKSPTFYPPPTEGMLAALGYHVGINGESLAVRQRILEYVLEGELPVVSSVAYTAEWGRPLTRRRFEKLTKFFLGMLEAAQNNRDMTAAIAHWQADLDWVIEHYAHLLAE
jgi:hypothetical protein